MDHNVMLLVEALSKALPEPPKLEFVGWQTPPLNVLDCVLSLNR